MKQVVIMVMRRSRSFSMVREAITPGTPQPVPTSTGMKLLPDEAETAEDTVHDEGDTGHIAHILQDGQQEEQNQHLGNEAQHRAPPATIPSMIGPYSQPATPMLSRKPPSAPGNDLTKQDIVGPVGRKGADSPAAICNGGAHGQGVHRGT